MIETNNFCQISEKISHFFVSACIEAKTFIFTRNETNGFARADYRFEMALRWGIACAGKISHDFTSALATLSKKEHCAVAVAARDSARAKAFAELHGIKNYYGSYEQLARDSEVGEYKEEN